MSELSNEPTTHLEDKARRERALSIDCCYFYVNPYSHLDECLRPDACVCWHDVQLLKLPADERGFYASASDLERISQ